MKSRDTEKMTLPLWVHISIAVLVVIYVAVNVFVIGGDAFVIALNNVAANPLALAVAIMALWLWRRLAVGRLNRQLWLGLLLGWVLWTVGEFWWTAAAFAGGEVPYPSWADFFWLVGNVAMGAALWLRARSLPKARGRLQTLGWWVAALFIGLTVLFVLIPILREPDPSWVTNVLNLLYPALDLLLLVLVLRILVTYREGEYGAAWSWLGAGFALHSVSNLVFSAADIAGVYLPEKQVNMLSVLGVDVPYTLSYGAWLVGLVMLAQLLRTHRPRPAAQVSLVPIPDTHVLVFCGADDRVMSVSHNHGRVFAPKMTGELGATALGLAREDLAPLLQELRTKRVLEPRTLISKCQMGNTPITVSGVAVVNLQGKYEGATLLAQVLTGDMTLDTLLTQEEQAVVRSVLKKAGGQDQEDELIKQLLTGFTMAHLQAFLDRAFAEGGGIMVDALRAELGAAVAQRRWRLIIGPDLSLDTSGLSLVEIREALPVLMETARAFVARLGSEDDAAAIIEAVRSLFDPAVLEQVARFE